LCAARYSSDLLSPSPPAEKAAPAMGPGTFYSAKQSVHLAVDTIGEEERVS